MAHFEQFKNTIQQLEGGYQNLRSDLGNKNSLGVFVGTNYGISAPVYEKWIGRVPTVSDMKNLSHLTAIEIFKKNYWDKLGAQYIDSQMIAETLVDHGINAGTGTAARIMQRVLNDEFNKNLVVDGALGTLSLEAINSTPSNKLFNSFSQARINDYKTKNNADAWYPIWKKRVETIASKFGVILSKKKTNNHKSKKSFNN